MKNFYVLFIISLISLFQYCSSSKKSAAGGMSNSITYVANVQPTITANCSPCHFPPKGFKKALDTYDAAKSTVDEIILRVNLQPGERGFMPFKHPRLSDSVINIFVKWKADGLLEK